MSKARASLGRDQAGLAIQWEKSPGNWLLGDSRRESSPGGRYPGHLEPIQRSESESETCSCREYKPWGRLSQGSVYTREREEREERKTKVRRGVCAQEGPIQQRSRSQEFKSQEHLHQSQNPPSRIHSTDNEYSCRRSHSQCSVLRLRFRLRRLCWGQMGWCCLEVLC